MKLEQPSREARSQLHAASASDENRLSFADLEVVGTVCRTMARCIIITDKIDGKKEVFKSEETRMPVVFPQFPTSEEGELLCGYGG